MLAPRKPNSIVNSGAHTRNALACDQAQRSVSTRKKIRVVMAIVIVTAMPYAAARLLDERNPSTNPTHAAINSQLTRGT
jgi:hypothetical protein